MKLNQYQRESAKTARYPHAGERDVVGLTYLALGLTGEAGEVAEKVKKILRDSGGVITPDVRLALLRELGDVQWYLAQLASELAAPLELVASMNLDKLADRADRGVLGGSGDNR